MRIKLFRSGTPNTTLCLSRQEVLLLSGPTAVVLESSGGRVIAGVPTTPSAMVAREATSTLPEDERLAAIPPHSWSALERVQTCDFPNPSQSLDAATCGPNGPRWITTILTSALGDFATALAVAIGRPHSGRRAFTALRPLFLNRPLPGCGADDLPAPPTPFLSRTLFAPSVCLIEHRLPSRSGLATPKRFACFLPLDPRSYRAYDSGPLS
jgi:hypothetical protein